MLFILFYCNGCQYLNRLLLTNALGSSILLFCAVSSGKFILSLCVAGQPLMCLSLSTVVLFHCKTSCMHLSWLGLLICCTAPGVSCSMSIQISLMSDFLCLTYFWCCQWVIAEIIHHYLKRLKLIFYLGSRISLHVCNLCGLGCLPYLGIISPRKGYPWIWNCIWLYKFSTFLGVLCKQCISGAASIGSLTYLFLPD